jgi:hypothetical protein
MVDKEDKDQDRGIPHEQRSKDKLKKFVDGEIKKLFTGILDYAEVAVDGKERWKVLRSRILKLSNETMNGIRQEVDYRYRVSYNPPGEDVVVIKRK